MKCGVIPRRVFETLRISSLVSLIEMDGWIDGFFMDFEWMCGYMGGWFD